MAQDLSALTPQSYFATFTELGQQLNESERTGDPLPSTWGRRGLSAQILCANCGRRPPQEPLQCSGCKAVIYCSTQCSRQAWKMTVRNPGFPSHKKLCASNKRHMEKLFSTEALLKSFPWGRLEQDGTFNVEVARGRFEVLGGTGTGFWSHRGGPMRHNQGEQMDAANTKYSDNPDPLVRHIAQMFHHLDGHDLLHNKTHLTDEQGWKLKPERIPYRNISKLSPERMPLLVTDFEGGVFDWDSWHQWRKLPKDSPAALLMHQPLTVYQLLVNTLKLTSLTAATADKRVGLTVHMLGAEGELNILPLFSEIALLLPHHDVTLRLWGSGIHTLCKAAQSEGLTSSPLRKSLAKNAPVFEYTAPRDLGSGKITIFLHGESPTWNTDDIDTLLRERPEQAPDALIALNAGLGSYESWMTVVYAAHLANLPFAVTEYCEQSLEYVVNGQFTMVLDTPPKRQHDIALNPFHRPGQRVVGNFKMPNLDNGFTLVVVEGSAKPKFFAD